MFRKLVKYALVFLFFAVVLDPTLRSWIGPSYDLTLRSIRTTFDDLVKSAPPHPVHARTPGKRPRVLTAKKINSKKARRLIVDKARSMEGTRYFFGGETAFGVDCSGLVVVSYRAAGIQLPHSSRLLSRLGRPVRLDALLPGDLAFFQTSRGHHDLERRTRWELAGDGMIHQRTVGVLLQSTECLRRYAACEFVVVIAGQGDEG